MIQLWSYFVQNVAVRIRIFFKHCLQVEAAAANLAFQPKIWMVRVFQEPLWILYQEMELGLCFLFSFSAQKFPGSVFCNSY